jgi:ABC-2 type transport system permease protein
MKRYLRIWWAQICYSLTRDMMFKANFLMWIFVDLTWFSLQLCFVRVLYLNVDTVAGWTQWEMVLLIATGNMIQQIFQGLFVNAFIGFPEMIRTGRLDFYLAQPAPTQFLVSTRLFGLDSIINSFVAFLLVLYAAHHFSGSWPISGLVAYFALVVVGVVANYSLMLATVTLAFWMTRAQGLISSYYQFFQIARIPREAFRGVFKLLFTWILPYLLVANVPAKTLLHGPSWEGAAALILVTVVLFIGSNLFFNFGLKRYGSASS